MDAMCMTMILQMKLPSYATRRRTISLMPRAWALSVMTYEAFRIHPLATHADTNQQHRQWEFVTHPTYPLGLASVNNINFDK
jgi:hypothetical protein